MKMKKVGLWILGGVCLLAICFGAGLFNSYETPEKCIHSTALLLHPLATTKIGEVSNVLAQVELDDGVLFVYENENHDVMAAELGAKKKGDKTRYSYRDVTVFRQGQYDEPGFTTMKNTTRDGLYSYGLYPKGSSVLKNIDKDPDVRQCLLSIEQKDYVLEVIKEAAPK